MDKGIAVERGGMDGESRWTGGHGQGIEVEMLGGGGHG